MNYTALARANVTIELFEDDNRYEALVVSTNGNMLQPYDTSTTLVGTVLRNNVDITSTIPNVRWTKWNPSSDNIEECTDWNKLHIGQASILITKDDIDSKSIFTFEAYDKYDKLLCSNSISLVDVNDLLASTKKPANPYIGQLWIDDSTEPVNLYAWNGYKWVISGSIGVVVNNLLYNTGFTYNMDKWSIVGESKLMYTPTPHTHLERRYLGLNSEVITDITRGISQTTVEEVVKDSDYSFQMLFYSSADTAVYSNNIIVRIHSINLDGKETLVEEKIVPANSKVQKLFFTFKSRFDTEKFKVEVLGEDNNRFNFNIAELALYNTNNRYPWTPNSKDSTSMLTQQNVWNALSNFGSVQGITSIKNEYTGQLEYYINASMINAGKVSAQYLDVYNLSVFRKDNPDIKTLEITDDGRIHIRVSELKIEVGDDETPTKIQDYVGEEVGAAEDALNNRIDGTEETLNGKIDETTGTLNDKIDTTKSDLDSKISETEDSLNDKISDTEIALNDKITSSEKKLQTNITETKTEFTAEMGKITERVSSTESQTEALIELTEKGVYLSAYDNGQRSFVDIGGEEVYIKSNSIKLEGYTTINGGFKVDTDGNMEANNGKFSGTITASVIKSDDSDDPVFSLTADGTLIARNAIISGQVGGIVPTTETMASSNGKFIVHGETGLMYTEGATVYQSNITDCTITNGTINIKDKFIVNADGKVTAKGFSGDMDDPEIKGGKINNATIKNSTIDGDTIKNVTITASSFAGDISNADITNSTFSGTLSSPTINTPTINNGTMTGTTITECAIKNNVGSLRINTDGSITATSLTATGNVSASSISTTGSMSAGSFSTTGNFSAASISATGSVSAGSVSTTGSVNITNNITRSNNIIYKGQSNTFIADHYAIGTESKVVGELSSNTLKLGQGAMSYGTTTVSGMQADTAKSIEVNFNTAFSGDPVVTVTLKAEDPNVTYSISNITKNGFTLYCKSSTATFATFNWMAIGAS